MAKFTANYKNWKIDIEDNGSVTVYENGAACDNTKAVLTTIAKESGFEFQEGANTRQMGRKLVDFLNAAPVAAKAEVKEEPKKERSTPAESFEASSLESATAKVRVYGKAQNRTALGIAHAYMVMYPHATLADLRKAFPNSLNPARGSVKLIRKGQT